MIQTLVERIAHSPLASRFLGGAFWSITATGFSSSISLVTIIFVARILGKEAYGQLIMIQSTLSMVGVVAGFGIGTTATKYVAELVSRDVDKLARILKLANRTVLVFGAIACTLLLLLSPFIASTLLRAQALTVPLVISTFSVLFLALDSYYKGVLIGLESMKAFAIATIAGAMAGVPFMLTGAYLYGLDGVAIGLVLVALLQSIISRLQMVKQLRYYSVNRQIGHCWTEWEILPDFALPAFLASLLIAPAHWMCHTMLANTANGYAELAILGIAMQWFSVLLFLPNIAGRVVLPIMTAHISNKDYAGAIRILFFSMGTNAVVTVPVALLVALCSGPILSLYGTDYHDGSLPLVIGVFTAALVSVQAPVGYMIAACSRMWVGTYMNLGWALAYIGLAYLLLDYGAAGVAIAMGSAYVAHAVWTSLFAVNIQKLGPLQFLHNRTIFRKVANGEAV